MQKCKYYIIFSNTTFSILTPAGLACPPRHQGMALSVYPHALAEEDGDVFFFFFPEAII